MAVEILERWKKRFQKRPALYPPPLLMSWPLREELFFAASLISWAFISNPISNDKNFPNVKILCMYPSLILDHNPLPVNYLDLTIIVYGCMVYDNLS